MPQKKQPLDATVTTEARKSGQPIARSRKRSPPTRKIKKELEYKGAVEITIGTTENIGEHNFLKIAISMRMECKGDHESIERTADTLSDMCAARLEIERDKAFGIDHVRAAEKPY